MSTYFYSDVDFVALVCGAEMLGGCGSQIVRRNQTSLTEYDSKFVIVPFCFIFICFYGWINFLLCSFF